MTNSEQVALESFLLDIDCLNELNPWLDDMNIFEILKMSKMEIRHSNFLAWLLNPNENHSFGDRILKDVICHIIKHNNEIIDKAFNIFNTTLWNYESFNVYREKDNIDILIVSNTLKVLVCIENKLFSQEHTEQSLRYKRKLDELYPEYEKLFIFLTPGGDEAIDYENWASLSYKELINIIETNMSLRNLNIKEKIFIENYISGVKRHIMEDTKLQEICSRIYFKHRQALDLIFENKPDMRDLFYSAIVEKLENEAVTGSIDFNKSGSSKTIIRFNTPYTIKLFPKLIEPRKSDWNSDFMFCYEIINRNYPLRLSAVLNNNRNLSEDELRMCDSVNAVIEKKPLREKWQWKSYGLSRRTQISEINFDEISDGEFNENKEDIINSIFENIMKAVKAFEDKLKKEGL